MTCKVTFVFGEAAVAALHELEVGGGRGMRRIACVTRANSGQARFVIGIK